MPIETLSIEVDASTRSAQRSFTSLKESITTTADETDEARGTFRLFEDTVSDTVSSLFGLNRSVDETGEEFAEARREAAAFEERLQDLDGETVRTEVDVDTDRSGLLGGVLATRGRGGGGGLLGSAGLLGGGGALLGGAGLTSLVGAGTSVGTGLIGAGGTIAASGIGTGLSVGGAGGAALAGIAGTAGLGVSGAGAGILGGGLAGIGTGVAGAAGLTGAVGAVLGSGLAAVGAAEGEENRRELQSIKQRIGALQRLEDRTGSLTATQRTQLQTLQKRAKQLEEQTGIIGGLQDAFSETGQAFREELIQVGEQFAPLIRDAISGLPSLIRRVGSAIRDVDFGETRQLLRSLGSGLSDRLPGLIRGFLQFGDAVSGVLNDFIEFTQGEQFGEIVTAINEAFSRKGFQSTLKAFGNNVSKILNSLAENAPGIIRGTVAVLDSILDIINAATPVITAFIDAAGAAGRIFAEFTRNSETKARRQEQARIGSPRGVNPVDRRLRRRRDREVQDLEDTFRRVLQELTIEPVVELDGRQVNEKLNQTERRTTGYRRGSE